MKNFKKISLTIFVALASAFIALWAHTNFFDQPEYVMVEPSPAVKYANLPSAPQSRAAPDLTFAAERTVYSVVHIKVKTEMMTSYTNPFFEWFYGDRYRHQEPQIREGAGSGVILTSDGYIVTNNHVIDNSDEITVVLNDKREFKAKLVGTDPTTDIALIKIDEKDLPYVKFGNSDALKLGEWVLAVGNPFNLTSTVTAGIVSAKGRNIGINRSEMSIEAFIQTDAAVNRGNSGGALVNVNGELIGINTAIASRTGSYTGYSFAVPATIVEKVVSDLKEFGQVQRALLGVSIGDVSAEIAEEYGLDKIEGVFIGDVHQNSAAEEAGIEAEDIIISIDGVPVNSSAELQKQISQHRPGNVIKVLIKRNNKPKQFDVTLRNMHGDTEIITAGSNEYLGAIFEEINKDQKDQLRIGHGIQISDLGRGKLKDAGLKEGFIITHVNKEKVDELNDLMRVVKNAKGGILIEGIYPDGELAYYVFSLDR